MNTFELPVHEITKANVDGMTSSGCFGIHFTSERCIDGGGAACLVRITDDAGKALLLCLEGSTPCDRYVEKRECPYVPKDVTHHHVGKAADIFPKFKSHGTRI